jgi:hypothetical protein
MLDFLRETSAFLKNNATILTAIGLLLTGTGAWATFFLISRRTVQISWGVGFRQEYAEFWKDDVVAVARRWITNDIEYAGISGLLAARIQKDENELSPDDNEKLDKIDRFLASLLRMHLFSKFGTRPQRRTWTVTYNRYWVPLIKSRTELREYAKKYWLDLEI